MLSRTNPPADNPRMLRQQGSGPALGDLRDSTVVAHPSAIGSVRRAITAVAARFPSATCLVQALAADAMLRRRRLASELRLGVRLRDHGDSADVPDVPIEAHAWVECDGGVVIGAVAHQSEFTVLTR